MKFVLQTVGLTAMAAAVLGADSPSSLRGADNLEGMLTRDLQATVGEMRTRLRDLLPQYTKRLLRDKQSPQAMAQDWMLEDPSFSDYSDSQLLQRFALATFYYSAGGMDWMAPSLNGTSWIQHDTHECEWGLLVGEESYFRPEQYEEYFYDGNLTSTCDQDDMYQFLLMADMDAMGVLPAELFDLLPSLRAIHLSGTGLNGTLPETMGNLPLLEVFHVLDNDFTGEIPAGLGNSLNMTSVKIEYNNISGPIPPELGQWSMLEILELSHNKLTGPIPPELGMKPYLASLDLSHNMLEGPLPVELGLNVSSLRFMILNDNPTLDGDIPAEWGADGSWEATFNIENTMLTGVIPDAICIIHWGLKFDCSDTLCGCRKELGCQCPAVAVDKKNFGWRE